MGKGGPKYTPDEARARIPTVIERVAMAAVDLRIEIEKHPLDSYEIESRVTALSGLNGHLTRLFHVVWRHEGLKRATEEKAP